MEPRVCGLEIGHTMDGKFFEGSIARVRLLIKPCTYSPEAGGVSVCKRQEKCVNLDLINIGY